MENVTFLVGLKLITVFIQMYVLYFEKEIASGQKPLKCGRNRLTIF